MKYYGIKRLYKHIMPNGDVLVDMHSINADALATHQYTGIDDKDGDPIFFGDTVRFADKVLWYSSQYKHRIQFGEMTREDALNEIMALPYHQKTVKSVLDYSWLLHDEIQMHWEVVNA